MAADHTFERARNVLSDAIGAGAFPAAVAEVGRAAGPIWTHAAGRLSVAADSPAASVHTIFDLASLTKVIATTTIALRQVVAGTIALEDPVAGRIPAWRGDDRHSVTVRDLLEHAAGLPAYRPYYRDLAGRPAFEAAIGAEPLDYAPRTRSIYSDPGFMLLGFILEDTAGTRLDAQFNAWRDEQGIDGPLAFRPPLEWRDRIAPTEDDPWRGRLLTGEVHDENAAALGDVAAHAGLFGTAGAVGRAARWWLTQLRESPIAARFAERSTVPGSSRALGWDTMLHTSSCGTRMSARAVGHTGFTGTSLWLDPERDLYFVLLSNRVHPTRTNDAIQSVRRAFHDAVAEGAD